jgi:hypothetical protein
MSNQVVGLEVDKFAHLGSAPFACAPGKKVAEDGLSVADQGRFRRTIGSIGEQPQDIAAQVAGWRRGRRVECSPAHLVDLDAVHLDDVLTIGSPYGLNVIGCFLLLCRCQNPPTPASCRWCGS